MILVFVGAGGSAAVDPEQYPTTVEFFKRLPPEITKDRLFQFVCEFLRTQGRDEQIDIETVLWTLGKFEDDSAPFSDPNSMLRWMTTGNQLGQLVGSRVDTAKVSEVLSDICGNQLKPLRERINAQVHQFYDKLPDESKLLAWDEGRLPAWIVLFRELENLDPVLEIFTTNYDRVLERVISLAEIKVPTGREADGVVMRLNTALWDNPGEPLDDGYGRLTKLHGSVDWKRENGEIICGTTDATGDIPILYPGFKGDPEEEPFSKFHEHLRAVVGKARAPIFIGFAFRDEYINGILSDLPPELSPKNLAGIKKFVISKDDSLPDLSFLGDCWHFNDGFTAEAVSECVEEVNRALMHVRRIRS